MLILLVLVVSLSIALSMGGGATYIWITHTHAWQWLVAHKLALGGAVALTASLTLLNLGLRWLRWTFLLRRFHARIPTRDTFRLFFATAAIITPFYVGELLRGAAIARRYRSLTSVVFWVWIVERCSDVAALLVWWGLATQQPAYWVAGASLLLSAPWLLARITLRLPDAEKLHTGQLTPGAVTLLCAGFSLAAWALPILSLFSVLQLLAAHGSIADAAQAFASGTLLGALTGAPAGLGTSGSVMIVRLTGAGLEPASASIAVLALRFGTQWFAVALGVVVAVLWHRSLLDQLKTAARVQQHFDALAPAYADDIPAHYRQQMLARKIDAMLPTLPPARPEVRGLDLGCGQGWYACELARRGYAMHGIDLSEGQIAQAEQYCRANDAQVALRTYDGVHLPYPDAHFDFAYSINVLHHVPNPDAQRALIAEVLRVLKPEGRFLLHEMNVENALFRGYMSYVFPLLKSIDEGTELWIRPTRLPQVPGGHWQRVVDYFTFVPEFMPARLLAWLRPIERWLEGSPLRKYSAHYMATLTREPAGHP